MSIPGKWTLYYSWGQGYSPTRLEFNANGRFSNLDSGASGHWSSREGQVLFLYDGGTSYNGNVVNSAMVGINSLSAHGCWYAVKDGSTYIPPEDPMQAAVDDAGNPRK